MPITETSIGDHATIEEELQALRNHIKTYRETLNDEGVWLFLVTLGCWSVSLPPLQLLAYLLAVWLFGSRISARSKETRSLPKLINALQERISLLAASEIERKAGLFDLIEIQKRELSVFAPFRQVKEFLFCWLFWGGSAIYWLYLLM